MRIKQENAWGELGSALGKGLIAGLAGTAAITLSQIIEMSITKRESSDAPIKVASQVTDVQPTSEETKAKVNQEIHWAYGTSWGIARGLIGLTGLKGLPATLVHFGAIWGTALVMLPKYDAAPPVTEEPPKTIAIDALHHAVYALAAGLVYDALDAGGKHERKLDKLVKQLHLKGIIEKLKP
ncbi:hypothetical protein [Mucilaginibacter lacusdianchii]|uniref:hypothetical protein n=1 Tax=Mucilaginibacter lacusdianchii TaxID=2684211 RepID=UPI0018EEDD8E|nr:hypothetical protein [Mucilaginibacter sp. JXJ CY 39]